MPTTLPRQIWAGLRLLASSDGVDAPLAIRLLDRFFGLFAMVCTLLLVFGELFFFKAKLASGITSVAVLAVTLFAWRISRRGQPKRAIALFAGMVWLIGTVTLFLGMPPSIAVFVLATAMVFATVLGVRWGTLFAGTYLLVYLAYIVLDAQGLAPQRIFFTLPGVVWFHHVVAILLTLLPIPELIASLRRLQLAAEQANRSRLTSLAAISQQIRSPMNGILGMAQVLEMTRLDAEQKTCVGGIIESAHELQALLDRFLDYVALEGGQASLRHDPFSWGDVVEALEQRIRHRHGAAAARLHVEMAPTLAPTGRGDASRIGSILDELIANALRYAGDGPVTLRLAPELATGRATGMAPRAGEAGNRVQIDVDDRGPGIAPHRIPGLFLPFGHQTAPSNEPLGLGLPLANAMAGALGGRLSLEHSSPAGCRFRLTLPAG